MKRLVATIANDLRLQFRNGFYFASAFVATSSIALLSWFEPQNAVALLPALLLGSVLINAFYFVAGLLLLERSEGTLLAQAATPLRRHEYFLAKLLTLTALSLTECLLIALSVAGFDPRLLGQAGGVVLASVLFGLTGIAVVARYESINEFLLPSVPCTFLLSLPLLGYLGVGHSAWYFLHPIQGPMELIQLQTPLSPPALAYAIVYPLLWVWPTYSWSRRSLDRARTA